MIDTDLMLLTLRGMYTTTTRRERDGYRKILRRFCDGETRTQIAADLGISAARVGKIINQEKLRILHLMAFDRANYDDIRMLKELANAEASILLFGSCRDRNKNICERYSGGESISFIARSLSLSRTRVHQILKKHRDAGQLLGVVNKPTSWRWND